MANPNIVFPSHHRERRCQPYQRLRGGNIAMCGAHLIAMYDANAIATYGARSFAVCSGGNSITVCGAGNPITLCSAN